MKTPEEIKKLATKKYATQASGGGQYTEGLMEGRLMGFCDGYSKAQDDNKIGCISGIDIKEKAKVFQEHKIKVGYLPTVAMHLTDGFVLGYHQAQIDTIGKVYSEDEVKKLLIQCKDRFSGSELHDYVSDERVIEYFFPNKHDND